MHLPRFSIRGLLKLTLVVAILSMLAVWCRDWPPQGDEGLLSPWTLASLIPIGFVCLAQWRFQWRPVRMTFTAAVMYALSLALPAMGDFEAWGYTMAYLSVAATPGAIGEIFDPPPPNGWFVMGSSMRWAVVCGGFANSLFLLSYMGLLLKRKWPIWQRLPRWSSTLALLLSVASLTLFYPGSSWPTPLPGCGAWIASMLALALAMRPLAESGSRGVNTLSMVGISYSTPPENAATNRRHET
jgi:hypothetical protein